MWRFFRNFATEMDKILKVHSFNDYARYIGAPEFLLGQANKLAMLV